MASETAKPILPLDYDEDESEDDEEEEEEDELFDNSKVDWRVKGNLLRGKDFSVSDNGFCPRCQANIFVFVILDELFPMGDMPEILYNLLAKGKAVLWSSQDKQACKKPPTFMCKGFCPPDPLGAGFNINWDTVNLTKVLKDLLKLNITKAQRKMQAAPKQGETETEDEDVNENDLIKVMLAKEKEKKTEEPALESKTTTITKNTTVKPTTTTVSTMKTTETKPDKTSPDTNSATKSDTITPSTKSSTTDPTTTATNVEYPISKDGTCPYCYSKNVRYIILIKDPTKDKATLPPTLESLLKQGKAFKMAKGNSSPPSFQCCNCTYGFNLDWSSTNLKTIFGMDDQQSTTTSSTTTNTTSPIVTTATTESHQFPNYPPPSFQPHGFQNTAPYAPYGYPPMYAPTAMPYGYPTPGYGIPPPGMPPMQLPPPGYPPGFAPAPGFAPPPGYGPPGGYSPSGFVPPGMSPPPPYSQPPGFLPPPGFPNQPFMPDQPFGMPLPGPNMPYGAPYGQQMLPHGGGGDFNRPPFRQGGVLRIPKVSSRGRYGKKGHHKSRWQAQTKYYDYYDYYDDQRSPEKNEDHDEAEDTHEDNYEHAEELEAGSADRFEQLLNKIDNKGEGTEGHEGTAEEEKPPGEEEIAMFSVHHDKTTNDLSDLPPGTDVEEPTKKEPAKAKKEPQPEKKELPVKQPQQKQQAEKEHPKSKSLEKKPVSSITPEASAEVVPVNEPVKEAIPEKIPSKSGEQAKVEQSVVPVEGAQGKDGILAKSTDITGDEESQTSMTSEMESDVLPAPSRKPAPRSRKRGATGRRKAASTRGGKRKKAVVVEEENVEGMNVDENDIEKSVTIDENVVGDNVKDIVSSENAEKNNSTDTTKEETNPNEDTQNSEQKEIIEEETPQPYKRMTRARASRQK